MVERGIGQTASVRGAQPSVGLFVWLKRENFDYQRKWEWEESRRMGFPPPLAGEPHAACAHHGATEGSVLRQHADSLGLSQTARAPVAFHTLVLESGTDALVASGAATVGGWAQLGHHFLLFWVHLLVPGQSLGYGDRGTMEDIMGAGIVNSACCRVYNDLSTEHPIHTLWCT